MKRLFAVLAAVSLLFLPVQARARDDRETKGRIAELSHKYEELEGQQKLIDQQMDQAKTALDKRIMAIQQLDQQISVVTAQVENLTERISLLDRYINDKQREIDEKQAEIDAGYTLLKKRLNALVRLPEGSTAGMVLGVERYSQFVNRTLIIKRVAEYDKELIRRLEEEKAQLTALKADIGENQDRVREDRAKLREKQQDLGVELAKNRRQIQDIALMEQQFQANGDALRKQMKQVQAEMDAIYAGLAVSAAQYVGGENAQGSMIHPAPGLTQITSAYGPRFNRSDFHTGVDFSVAGAYGKDIVAANAGKVALVNTTYTPGYGYGKYVILDHGGGITTLYAHCSAITVQVGQVVAQGEKIAEVGSTGWSTGPHCHFEVRVNKVHTNPMPYLRRNA